MRSCVITKTTSNNLFRSFVKGSPEKLIEICINETIPKDYQQVLDKYTIKGYRVIALASKIITEFKNDKEINIHERDYFEK